MVQLILDNRRTIASHPDLASVAGNGGSELSKKVIMSLKGLPYGGEVVEEVLGKRKVGARNVGAKAGGRKGGSSAKGAAKGAKVEMDEDEDGGETVGEGEEGEVKSEAEE